ncbi:hypothetical protein MLD38_037574 [Melastoma candidum]|uniref:Uncharacterized protein n=1 Tax=Melastoma candidum TaxID=119954 RepID=A0ACB9LN34_9MYRT|nr:hypothetical protein MLD38_037574 [Melastoma candidum]
MVNSTYFESSRMDETASEVEPNPPSPSSSSASQLSEWIREQDLLKRRLVTVDDFPWKLPSPTDEVRGEVLAYVGGLDISFCTKDPSIGCATLVVLDLRTLAVVLEESTLVRLHVPYVPGFLAFREAPVLLSLLETVKEKKKDAYPQVINETYLEFCISPAYINPCFGLACHLGVLADLPSIGIGKNLHFVDGLTMSGVKQLLRSKENLSKDSVSLIGSSGHTWGVALRPTQDASKPIFVSVGCRISLDTAFRIVRSTCKYKNPEPVRQADMRSRAFLRGKSYPC